MLVNKKEHIKHNLFVFDKYRHGSETEKQFAYDLIQKGRCFIAYKH